MLPKEAATTLDANDNHRCLFGAQHSRNSSKVVGRRAQGNFDPVQVIHLDQVEAIQLRRFVSSGGNWRGLVVGLRTVVVLLSICQQCQRPIRRHDYLLLLLSPRPPGFHECEDNGNGMGMSGQRQGDVSYFYSNI